MMNSIEKCCLAAVLQCPLLTICCLLVVLLITFYCKVHGVTQTRDTH